MWLAVGALLLRTGRAGLDSLDLSQPAARQIGAEVSRAAQDLSQDLRAKGPAVWTDALVDREDFCLGAHGGVLFASRAATEAYRGHIPRARLRTPRTLLGGAHGSRLGSASHREPARLTPSRGS